MPTCTSYVVWSTMTSTGPATFGIDARAEPGGHWLLPAEQDTRQSRVWSEEFGQAVVGELRVIAGQTGRPVAPMPVQADVAEQEALREPV